MSEIPDWLARIRDAALTITGRDLTAFLPPEDSDAADRMEERAEDD